MNLIVGTRHISKTKEKQQQTHKMQFNIYLLIALVVCLPYYGATEAPSVALMNAAKPGLKMPVAGIGTWGYVHTQGTGIPGEVWNDTIAEKSVKEWLALGGRRKWKPLLQWGGVVRLNTIYSCHPLFTHEFFWYSNEKGFS